MTTALEIAKYVLARTDRSITGKRLQKLVYFCDAWHMTALDRALFPAEPEAWKKGPVYRELWDRTGFSYFGVSEKAMPDVEVPTLPEDSKAIIESVLSYYDQYSDYQLIELAHEEGSPWKRVYVEYANNRIERESMREHYSGVIARNEARPALPVTVYNYVLQEDMDEIETSLDDATPAPGLVSMLIKAKTG